ncbi:MAG: hypothetical protein ACQESF_03035 [Nanobdellota archaeon]
MLSQKDHIKRDITGISPGKGITKLNSSFDYYLESEKLFQKIDESKTPNDFGFQKLCFPLLLSESLENESVNTSFSSSPSFFFENKKTIDHKVKEPKKSDLKKNVKSLLDELENIRTDRCDFLEAQKNESMQYGGFDSNFYSTQTSVYNNFMNSYMDEKYEKTGDTKNDISMPGETKSLKQGDEVIDYKERKEYAKKVMLNSRYGNKTMPHSSQAEKQKYEMWKASSKFNQILSFIMYDSLQMLQ